MSTIWRQFDLSTSYEEGDVVPDWIPTAFIELAGREIINHPESQKRYFGKLTGYQSRESQSLYKLKDESEEGSEIRLIAIQGPFDPNTQPVVMGVDVTRESRNIAQPVPHPAAAPRDLNTQVDEIRPLANSAVMDRMEYRGGGNEIRQTSGSSRNLRRAPRRHRLRQAAEDDYESPIQAFERVPQQGADAAQTTFGGYPSSSQSAGTSGMDQDIKVEFDEDGVHIGRNLSNVSLSGDFSYVAGNTIRYGPSGSVEKVIRGPVMNMDNITFYKR
ncbi:hypothetical protein JR316_0000055 [Psilocybe cubensis]|uniref:Uncharacterized protein n=2 Tax=Psilocybe cubensis TaxID=181762 RepID=A0ACB8HEB3_PSICU|nr:hypothetical protein JR316_0000055 [Psilocybe cubensis]KAH9485992.1 hypothetical protein JR316_0000055 [Psilocybe cubensis]